MKKSNKNPGHVVRLSHKNHQTIMALTEGMRTDKGRLYTLNERLEVLLTTAERFQDTKVCYATKVFQDVADARGQAILEAVRNKTIPTVPCAVAVLYEDTL